MCRTSSSVSFRISSDTLLCRMLDSRSSTCCQLNGTGWEVILKNLGESSDYLILLSRIDILQPEAASFGSQKTRCPGDTVIRKHLILDSRISLPFGSLTFIAFANRDFTSVSVNVRWRLRIDQVSRKNYSGGNRPIPMVLIADREAHPE